MGFWYELVKVQNQMLCFCRAIIVLLSCLLSHFARKIYIQILAYKTWQCKFSTQILWANFTHKNHLFVIFKFCLACAKCFEIKLVFVRSTDTLQNLGDLVKRDFIVARA